jgi:hypothetical protein
MMTYVIQKTNLLNFYNRFINSFEQSPLDTCLAIQEIPRPLMQSQGSFTGRCTERLQSNPRPYFLFLYLPVYSFVFQMVSVHQILLLLSFSQCVSTTWCDINIKYVELSKGRTAYRLTQDVLDAWSTSRIPRSNFCIPVSEKRTLAFFLQSAYVFCIVLRAKVYGKFNIKRNCLNKVSYD